MKSAKLLLVFSAALCLAATVDPPTQGCTFGPQLARALNNLRDFGTGQLYTTCNHTCTQVVCSGTLNLDVVNLKLPFCFGLNLNHCDNPASLGYHVQAPTRNYTLTGKLTHSETESVPGPSTLLGRVSIIVNTQLEHVNASYIKFAINTSVKLTSDRLEFFPYHFTVLPAQYIPVTPCNQTASTTQAPLAEQCAASPAVPSSVAPKVTPKSETFGKSCEVGMLKCGLHEMCVYSGTLRKDGVCNCEMDSSLNPATGFCTPDTITKNMPPTITTTTILAPKTETTVSGKPKSAKHTSSETNTGKNNMALTTTLAPKTETTDTGKPKSAKHNSNEAKSGKNTTVIIACSAVGGVLLLVVIVSVIICIGRRRRNSIYRDRHQLLTDEDEDDTNAII